MARRCRVVRVDVHASRSTAVRAHVASFQANSWAVASWAVAIVMANPTDAAAVAAYHAAKALTFSRCLSEVPGYDPAKSIDDNVSNYFRQELKHKIASMHKGNVVVPYDNQLFPLCKFVFPDPRSRVTGGTYFKATADDFAVAGRPIFVWLPHISAKHLGAVVRCPCCKRQQQPGDTNVVIQGKGTQVPMRKAVFQEDCGYLLTVRFVCKKCPGTYGLMRATTPPCLSVARHG